jgi:hypothetical protein
MRRLQAAGFRLQALGACSLKLKAYSGKSDRLYTSSSCSLKPVAGRESDCTVIAFVA